MIDWIYERVRIRALFVLAAALGALSMFVQPAAAGVTATVTPDTFDLYKGTRIVVRDLPTEQACVDAAKANGAGKYTCRTQTGVIVAVATDPPPPPTCTTPKPADLTRSQTCPSGTIGSWQQSTTSSPAPYPTCWTVSDWQPSAPPAGACAPIVVQPPPAPTGALYASDCSNTKGPPGSGNTEILGRDGKPGVCKISIAAGGEFFGDKFASAELKAGDEIWVKIGHFFPASFCAGFINQPDGNGATKWLRMDWGGPTGTTQQRFTLELGGFNKGACGPGPNVWGAVPEIDTDYAAPYNYEYANKVTIPRDRWVTWQFHMKLATTRAGSVLEQWLDDQYLGNLTPGSATMPANPQYPTSGGNSRVDFYIGNYWNGKALKSSTMYMDDIVITKTPNAKDSGGRPYIAP